jgi:hypothetical protein
MACAQLSIATNSPNGAPLSTHVVAYTIDARLDTDHKSLDATETLTYHNLTGQPLTTFPIHLYLNAFRPESTFSAETHRGGSVRGGFDDTYPDAERGSITLSRIDADTYGDLTSTLHFTALDDGNMDDHTVAEITLPRPLAPGDSVTFHFAFHDQFPQSVARNGYKRDFIMGGQWFPKVGVFWHGAWNCHQYHATTEFFSDFGAYTVNLTVPRNYTVGASGVPTSSTPNPDGTRTLGFYGEDIHDFAFAASPHFTVTDGTYLSALGPVKIHVLALAAHPHIGPRYLEITRRTLERFEKWYGPYPYKIITVIDPEPGSEMQGMEYPTLFTADGTWTGPFNIAEVTAEHEFGHQYWYGMVATNEFEEAWLDEGINSYTEVKTLADIYGPGNSLLNRRWANLGDAALQRTGYIRAPDWDPVTRFAWKFRNEGSYDVVTYGKTATLLATLEGIIGHDTMQEALRTYFQRYRFTHPTTEDFLRTIEAVAVERGKAIRLTNPSISIPSTPATQTSYTASTDTEPPLATSAMPSQPPFASGANEYVTAPEVNSSLRPFIDQAVYGTRILDYAVASISSQPTPWWNPDTKNPMYEDNVLLQRKGDFVLPVTVEVVFSDGSRLRERWDGVDRWTRLTWKRNAKIVSAEIDPDHIVPLDADMFNNSRTTTYNFIAPDKIAGLWLCWQQFAAQLIAWIV